jgi:hypothetical protein
MPAWRAMAVTLSLAALATTAAAQTPFDYVTFDGIDYVRWAEEPGRALTRDDLGPEFAKVECSFFDDRRTCPFGVDAAAAYLPTGTRMYTVRGYRTEFRLAAVVNDRVFLYQVWRSPRAKVGGDLYDIAGRVRAIQVRHGDSDAAVDGPSMAVEAADTTALVDLLLRGEMRPPKTHPYGEPRYWITLWLADGTTLGRPYFGDTSEVLGGLRVSKDFRRILERYVDGR